MTFLAEDTHMPSGRICVGKRLLPEMEDPKFIEFAQERFNREAACLEQLGNLSEQIPTLYAYFREKKRFYLIQEYIEGRTLTKYVSEVGLFSQSEAIELLSSLLAVLDLVHKRNIIHRDIKPDNIILRQSDNKPILIDFGAVKESLRDGNSIGQTKVIGTPGFMPPEQGVGRPTFSSDLYSLAVTIIFILTGFWPQRLPYDYRTSRFEWRRLVPSLNATLADVLDQALSPAVYDRYESARDMLDAMGDLHLDMLTEQMLQFRRRKPQSD